MNAKENKGGTRQRKRLGEMLIEAGLIDEIQLTVALGLQKESGLKLGKQLLKLGFVEEADLALFLKDETDMGVPLTKRKISPDAIKSVPEKIAFKYKVVPVACVGRTIVIATADPDDIKTMDNLAFEIGKKLHPVRAFEWDIESALLKFYKGFSEDELSMLTNRSSVADQYDSAHWTVGNEVLVQSPHDNRAITPPPTARPGETVYTDQGPVKMPKAAPPPKPAPAATKTQPSARMPHGARQLPPKPAAPSARTETVRPAQQNSDAQRRPETPQRPAPAREPAINYAPSSAKSDDPFSTVIQPDIMAPEFALDAGKAGEFELEHTSFAEVSASAFDRHVEQPAAPAAHAPSKPSAATPAPEQKPEKNYDQLIHKKSTLLHAIIDILIEKNVVSEKELLRRLIEIEGKGE